MSLYFASQNAHKLAEIQSITSVPIKSLRDLGHSLDLQESGSTLEENALQKARFVYNTFQVDCFSEDSGLEIEALNGAPGVNSARFAGASKDASQNIEKVLELMKTKQNRSGRFRAVIALIINGEERLFEGVLKGRIVQKASGSGGFGYDPIFSPNNELRTLAELSLKEKNAISHRGQAIRKMLEFVETVYAETG